MTESDDALMLRVAREEIKRQAAEIERLETRLEVSPDHPYDGIYCRDATIKLQDERIERLEKSDHELTGALNAIAAMKDHAYYQVRREQVAVDAHSIAYGALARAESHKAKRVGFKESQLAFLEEVGEVLNANQAERQEIEK